MVAWHSPALSDPTYIPVHILKERGNFPNVGHVTSLFTRGSADHEVVFPQTFGERSPNKTGVVLGRKEEMGAGKVTNVFY